MKWIHWQFVELNNDLAMARSNPFEFANDLALEDDREYLPDEPGVYLLGAGTEKREHYADCTMFAYPWGASPIYYIGATEESIRDQLNEIANELRLAKYLCKQGFADRDDFKHYGAAFGAMAVWFISRRDDDCEKLLRSLFACFRSTYGAIPVANSDGDDYL